VPPKSIPPRTLEHENCGMVFDSINAFASIRKSRQQIPCIGPRSPSEWRRRIRLPSWYGQSCTFLVQRSTYDHSSVLAGDTFRRCRASQEERTIRAEGEAECRQARSLQKLAPAYRSPRPSKSTCPPPRRSTTRMFFAPSLPSSRPRNEPTQRAWSCDCAPMISTLDNPPFSVKCSTAP
jgi:hypothetical protein